MFWIETLIPPILGAVVGFIVWYLQSRVQKIQKEQAKLHDERRKIYSDILEPYIKIFSGSMSNKEIQKAIRQITSFKYRKKAFDFTLIGDDQVVRSFNDMMQYAFKSEASETDANPVELMELWGNFLLEIRRSLNNSNTSLTEIDMLRGYITDIDQIMNNKR